MGGVKRPRKQFPDDISGKIHEKLHIFLQNLRSKIARQLYSWLIASFQDKYKSLYKFASETQEVLRLEFHLRCLKTHDCGGISESIRMESGEKFKGYL